MEYLGYTVSAGKISVSTKKVEAVADWPVPKTQKERPYGSIDGLTAEVPATEGYADACLFGSLRDSQVTAHFRAMPDPSGGRLGRDVHRGYRCFNSGDCS
eukprot:1530209-Rhodomonas_salina.1